MYNTVISVKHFANDVYDSLRNDAKSEYLVDYSLDKPIRINKFQMLVMASALAKRLKKETCERIGIAIPNSGTGMIANIAVVLANKIPVNMNFSLSSEINQHCIQLSGTRCILTVSKMREKFSDFPWENAIDIDTLLKSYKANKLLCLKYAFIHSLPKNISKYLLNIPQYATNEELALLFTSGSSGKPKGVMLSHDNIRSNIKGISQIHEFPEHSKILANLPLFHSFGFTVTMWFSIINNIKIVTVPSPLEINKTLLAIEKESVTVLLGTPTFLRGYLKKGSSRKFNSLEYVIAGAEKSKLEFISHWENIASCVYLEGYGLTEASPVISINSPKFKVKHGSAGRLLPEIFVKTISPETGEPLNRLDTGLLCFRGPNIFGGYLNDREKTQEVLKDGWLITGDIGRIDEGGYLHIEGRLSRFSKIGGEMIPHETIEHEIINLMNWNEEDDIKVAVTGIPHEGKGEQLVVITSIPISLEHISKSLSEKFGNLWTPKIHKLVNKIPVLASGKLDLVAISEIANED